MEEQPGLLASVLDQRDGEYGGVYRAFRAAVSEALSAGRLTARHGEGHWRAVEIYSTRLVPERIFGQMATAEILVLAVACIAHDLRSEGREEYEWLSRQPSEFGLDETVAGAVRRACEDMYLPGQRLARSRRWSYLGREAIDIRRVVAVLRLADTIDVSHTDCPMPAEIDDIEPEKATSWPHERGLTVGLIDPREGVLRLDLIINNKLWRQQVTDGFMPYCQQAIAAVRNVLLGSGMAFREIELHDLHAKPTADVARAQELMRTRAGTRRRPSQPFKLLDPYDEREPHLLAARDEDIVRVAGRALTSRITVLVGENGVGKTSLMAAGVIPWLRLHGYDGVLARCLFDPTQSLIDAVKQRLLERHAEDVGLARADLNRSADDTIPPPPPSPRTLPEAATRLSEGRDRPVVLVLDQCQELFTRLGSRTRLEFARDLAGLLSLAGEPVHVVLVIQSDFFVRLVELLGPLPTLYHEVVELPRLTRDQAELVIQRALGRFRLRFEQLVISHVVDDLATSEGILPIELQICCDTLARNVEEDERVVRYDLYRRIGPGRKIVEGLVESRLRNFRWRRLALAKSLLIDCVTAQRAKALLRAEECAVDIGADLATCQELLEELTELGLLRRLDIKEGRFYELRHSYLATLLESWISDVETEAKDVDDLLHRELNNFERFGLLLDEEKLKLVHQYRRRLTFTPEELELAIRSAAQYRYEVNYWFGRVNELSVSQQMVLCVDLLYSPEPDLRDALRLMIGKLDHAAVLPTLLTSLREAEAPVRETAIEVLREINQNLVQALQSGDRATQQQAAYALGQIGARHAVKPLVESAQHASDEVREQAAEALAEIDRTKSAELLIRSCRSGNRASRWNAAKALGRLGRDATVRERLAREAAHRQTDVSLCYAYARACLEGRQLADAERALADLERRAVPEEQRQLLVEALEELQVLREEEQRGVFAWPMYRGSVGGGAWTPTGMALPLELKWEFHTGDCVYSSPAVADGKVFFSSSDHKLYALDADSGAERWTCRLDGEPTSTPCVLDGRVYIGTADGDAACVDAETGEVLWRLPVGGAVTCSVRGRPELLLVGTSQAEVVAFSGLERGRVLWRRDLGAPVTASPALTNGLVVTGTAEEGLAVLAAETGELLWRWRMDGGLAGSPAVSEDGIVCGSGSGRVDLLSCQGELVWSAWQPGPTGSSPAVFRNRVLIGGTAGELVSFDRATGRVTWTFQTEGEVTASPTVAGGTVFFGSQSGHLFALRAKTGELLWRYRTGYSIHSSPAVADRRLFVALRFYNMCAFAEPVEVEEPSR